MNFVRQVDSDTIIKDETDDWGSYKLGAKYENSKFAIAYDSTILTEFIYDRPDNLSDVLSYKNAIIVSRDGKWGVGITGTVRTVFTMNGGEISGNTAGTDGTGVRRAGGTFNLNGGVVAATGANIAAVVNGAHNLNAASPRNAVIIAWNRPTGTLNYAEGTNTHLTLSSGATAIWANIGGALGISFTNGTNRGWIKAW